MRIGADGLILAANDAALALLGAQEPAQALNKFMTAWIVPAQMAEWRNFATTVTNGTPLSVECNLTDLSGIVRHVSFHGVPMIDHADGIPSLILGARDVTSLRRIEAALHESEAIRQKLAANPPQPQVDNTAMVQALEAKLNQVEADRDQLERSLSRLPQLEQLLKQGRLHLQELRKRLDDTAREREQLAAQLSERESANEQLWAEQAELQQSLGSQHARDLKELRAQLEEANAVRDEVSAKLAAREHHHEHLGNERTQLQQTIEAHQQELADLRGLLENANTDREQLVAQLADRVCQHELVLTQQEERHKGESDLQQEALELLRGQMHQAATEREQLLGRLNGVESTNQRQIIERDEMQQTIDAHRRELGALQAQIDDTNVERARFEDALGSALGQLKQNEKMLSDQRVELQGLDLAIRRVEPLAAAGRLAANVAGELAVAISDIDARAACLVAECAADSTTRGDIEQMRAGVIQVASLARQILQAGQNRSSEEQTSC